MEKRLAYAQMETVHALAMIAARCQEIEAVQNEQSDAIEALGFIVGLEWKEAENKKKWQRIQ